MTAVIRKLYEFYDHVFNEIRDHRTENYLFIETPPTWFAILLIGFLMMIKYGPIFMAHREPYRLKTLLKVYNLTQIILNLALGIYCWYLWAYVRGPSLSCQPIDYSDSQFGRNEANIVYCYFLLKILDLLDTAFIILKKDNRRLSFLHCYHHFAITAGSYLAVRWVPGGSVMMLGLINTFVHAFMYSYYFLTSINPQLKKSLWWKKHITHAQMAQFIFLTVYYFRVATQRDCVYPQFLMLILSFQNSIMFLLFADFYRKSYVMVQKSSLED